MNKRSYMVLLSFLLVFIYSILGNYIYKFSNGKYIDESDKDAYFQNPRNDFTILVEVEEKRLILINNADKTIVKSYTIATGKPDSPTPLGTFKIIEKAKWGEGFGTRWMGLNVPWGNYGIHGTNKPGSIGGNLSEGCIRMRNNDVEELYSMVTQNTIVKIKNGLYGPFGQGFRELRPGHTGADVLEVQKRLAQKGYYRDNLDGIYGENMKKALITYLKDNHIPLTDRVDDDIYMALDIILIE